MSSLSNLVIADRFTDWCRHAVGMTGSSVPCKPIAINHSDERNVDSTGNCGRTRMGERARCLPGDQTGLANLGALSVRAARRPWPTPIEPTSLSGGKTKGGQRCLMCGRAAGIPFPVSRSMHFLPAVDVEGGAGDVLRPIGG